MIDHHLCGMRLLLCIRWSSQNQLDAPGLLLNDYGTRRGQNLKYK